MKREKREGENNRAKLRNWPNVPLKGDMYPNLEFCLNSGNNGFYEIT